MKAILIIVLFGILTISGCGSNQWEYIKHKIGIQPLVVGYSSVVLKEDLIPEITLEYEDGKHSLSEAQIEQINAIIDQDRQYMIEGTAGGTQASHKKLAQLRSITTAEYLERNGINPDKIKIVEYDPSKKGKKTLIYTVTY